MTFLRSIILWCLLGVLLVAGLLESNTIGHFSRISLRYETPVSGVAAHRARQHSIANDNTFWPTFWREGMSDFSIGHTAAQSNFIAFSGDANLIWHAEYIMGSAPSSVDSIGIAVSEALAHRLWGSIDIVGMQVEVCDFETRTIRGVFRGSTYLALISFHIEDTTGYWSGVELSGGIPNPTRRDVENFTISSGLGPPDYVLTGGVATLARFMAIFPLLIIIPFAVVWVFRNLNITKTRFPFKKPVIFARLIIFAIFLPQLLDALPPWLIPTRWSDFAFWSNLISQAGAGILEFLSVNPMLIDVQLRIHILRQLIILFLSTILSLITIKNPSG